MITFGGALGMGQYTSEGRGIFYNGEHIGSCDELSADDGVANAAAIASALNCCQGMTLDFMVNAKYMKALHAWFEVARELEGEETPSKDLRIALREVIEDAATYRGLCK